MRDEILRIGVVRERAQLHGESAVRGRDRHRRPRFRRQDRRNRRRRRHGRQRRSRNEHGFARNDRLHLDIAAAALRDSNPVGRGVREIDHPPMQERSTIVDAHDHSLAGGHTRHLRIRRQRQRRVRRGHRVHVVDLSDRGLFAVELASVPGRDAALLVRAQRRRRHVFPAKHRVRPVCRTAQPFEPWLRVRNGIEVGGNV